MPRRGAVSEMNASASRGSGARVRVRTLRKLRRIVATTGPRDYGPRPRGILAPVSERMIWLVAMVDEFAGADGFEGVEIDQIVERLAWTPRERLDYLLDMLAFEERAHRARRIPAGS